MGLPANGRARAEVLPDRPEGISIVGDHGTMEPGGLATDLVERPPMVGREKELATLVERLDDAHRGKGSLVLLSGEAGIGKTRLLEEVQAIARERGFLVLTGHAMYESLTPYMPFFEALKSGGLEHLFSEEAPRVEGAYLVTHSGLLVREVVREHTDLDANLFASMLATVSGFVEDSLVMMKRSGDGGTLDRLSHGGFTILVEHGKSADLAVVLTGRENEFLIEDMREAVSGAEKAYGNLLAAWDGDDEMVTGVEELLDPLVKSGKYDGTSYGTKDSKARRNLLFENVALGLARHASNEPILACLEDLQWADPSTLALLHHVARSARDVGLVLLGTFRPEDLAAVGGTHPLVAAMERLNRDELPRTIELARLSTEDTATLARQTLGMGGIPEVERRVYGETEGNPLFVIQLARLLVEEGILRKEDGQWRLVGELLETGIPRRVRDALARRLSRLASEQRDVLECAAVIGEEFDLEILAASLNADRRGLLSALRSLEEEHRLIRRRAELYRFDHVKIKEVAYAELPEGLRREYHGAVARAMETLGGGSAARAGDVAFHWLRSGEKGKALPHLLRAAEGAKKQYANAEAVRFYYEALALSEDAKTRNEILEGLAAVHVLVGDFARAIETNERRLESATTSDEKARVHTSLGKIRWLQGEVSEAIRLYNVALDLAGTQASKEAAMALAGLGHAHLVRSEYREAREVFTKVLDIHETIGDDAGVAGTLNNIGNAYMGLGDYDRALEYYSRCVPVSERIGHLEFLANHLNNIGVIHYYKGDFAKALEYYGMSRAMKDRIGNRLGAASTAGNMAQIYADQGEVEKAMEILRRNLSTLERLGDPFSAAGLLHHMGTACHGMGDDENALRHITRSLELREGIGDLDGIAECLCGLADLELSRGNVTRAAELGDRASSLTLQSGGLRSHQVALRTLGVVHRAMGHMREAEKDLQEGLQICREIGDRFSEGWVRYELGLLYAAKGDSAQAQAHLEAAVEVFERARAKPFLERARKALVAAESA